MPVITGIVFTITLIVILKIKIKKPLIFLIYIGTASVSLILLAVSSAVFGNEKIYIANLISSFSSSYYLPPFYIAVMRRLVSDIPVTILLGLVISGTYIFILVRKKLLTKSVRDIFFIALITVIPMIIVCFKLCFQYSYVW